MRLEKIAVILGLSKSRVFAIEQTALRKLRRAFKGERELTHSEKTRAGIARRKAAYQPKVAS